MSGILNRDYHESRVNRIDVRYRLKRRTDETKKIIKSFSSGEYSKLKCLDIGTADGLMDDVDNNLNKIAMGITCMEDKDCLLYAKKRGISGERLDLKNFECGVTAYTSLPDLISCNTKQDCLDSIESQIDLSSVIRCGKKGFCEMTQFSMIGLQKLYIGF